jgi:hypothetical protein
MSAVEYPGIQRLRGALPLTIERLVSCIDGAPVLGRVAGCHASLFGDARME